MSLYHVPDAHLHPRTSLLSHALIGYEQRKVEITEAIARIRATLGGKAPTRLVQRSLFTPCYPAQARQNVPCRQETDGFDDEAAVGEG
jgi:hypothetical protein